MASWRQNGQSRANRSVGGSPPWATATMNYSGGSSTTTFAEPAMTMCSASNMKTPTCQPKRASRMPPTSFARWRLDPLYQPDLASVALIFPLQPLLEGWKKNCRPGLVRLILLDIDGCLTPGEASPLNFSVLDKLQK